MPTTSCSFCPLDWSIDRCIWTHQHFRKVILLCGLLIPLWSGIAPSISAQSYTISGFVTDSESSEKLIGANIFVYEQNIGTVTNNYGFYSITLPADSVYLRVSYLGFESRTFEIDLQADVTLHVELTEEAVSLEGVEIVADRIEESVASTQMSTIDVSIREVQKLPALFGETDILKALQLLPGVQAGSEGSNGLYVRGGGPDQNLILLDGAPVYNASHIFGFFSVFNPEALQNVTLIKGGFPSRYGGRLSSVIDISMKEGNLKKYETDGSLGLISSKLTLQGPIIKDKMSFIVSGRRTYIDYIARPFIRSGSNNDEDAIFFFYDLNAKVNYIVSDRSRLYLSLYSGKDKFGATYEEDYTNGSESFRGTLDWGNLTSTLRWNYLFSNRLFANTTITYSKYQFNTLSRIVEQFQEVNTQETFNEIVYRSGIEDWNAKIDFDYRPSPAHYIRFGANATRHAFTPGIGRYKFEETGSIPLDTLLTPETETFKGTEYYAYIEDDILLSDKLKVNAGVHFSGMAVSGVHYTSFQPRVSLRYLIGSDLSFKASYGTMQQYLHLLSNSGINLPTDLWVAATDRIRPQEAWQAAGGFQYAFPNRQYELSLEGYYKGMKNLIEFKPGSSFLATNEDWQEKVEVGRGWSYGGEVFLQKKQGRTTGWVGYTLSWTERKFNGLNQGQLFPYRYDRRHDLSVVVTHQVRENMDIGMTWVYGTGNAITLATSRFQDAREIEFFYREDVVDYGGRNSFRMDPYHRLDIAFNWHRDRAWYSRKGTSTFTLGIYNVYNRKNPFFIYATSERTGNDPSERESYFRQVSLFPIMPSISYRFHF